MSRFQVRVWVNGIWQNSCAYPTLRLAVYEANRVAVRSYVVDTLSGDVAWGVA